MKKIVIVLLLLAVAGGAYWYFTQDKSTQYEGVSYSNGRLEFARMDVASLYPGRVERLTVSEGQHVQQGDILAELSSSTSSSQLQAAKAQQVRAEQAVSRAQAEVQARKQQLTVAQLELDNAKKMRQERLISQSELEKRIAARDAAKAAVDVTLAAQWEASAAVDAAKAQVEQASSVNEDMQVRAPQAGRVEYTIAEVGNVIPAGGKVVSLLNLNDVSMNLFFQAPVVNKIALNSEARIVLDGLDSVFPAKVVYIAAQSQFTPKFVETAEEREKLVFKVKLKIDNETVAKIAPYLKGGMTGNGYVLTAPNASFPPELAVKLPQ
ncbi:HlyD family secretion protein [Spirabiliibacterium falconis]|uniref:HlyD family secretion protein n=1 Tax=Spirabiliibacterium falconis TaxID=572023 RepID=UPI001AACBC97|nr:biotin/lipoyl-binding protein [Spirabiliibacterium falconis]MBE2894914.1 HlyD family efflux transporter periplasmic adaptor subunit [Spirabiliibacterium falconis]